MNLRQHKRRAYVGMAVRILAASIDWGMRFPNPFYRLALTQGVANVTITRTPRSGKDLAPYLLARRSRRGLIHGRSYRAVVFNEQG